MWTRFARRGIAPITSFIIGLLFLIFTLLTCWLLMLPTAATAATITAMEYYIDTDPGTGHRATIDVPQDSGTTARLRIPDISTAELPAGPHLLFIHAKDSNNKWGPWRQIRFETLFAGTSIQPVHIDRAEYFIDTNPGEGLGTEIPPPPGELYDSLKESIQVTDIGTSNLTIGPHTLYVRMHADDGTPAGIWGKARPLPFDQFFSSPYNLRVTGSKTITDIEYFFDDNDPGEGNANPLPLPNTSGSHFTGNLKDIQTDHLSPGHHILYIRAKDSDGFWGPVHQKWFEILSTSLIITGAEYFIDTDPGQGNGTPLQPVDGSFDEGGERVFAEHNSTGLNEGEHSIFVRAKTLKNATDLWSDTASRLIQVNPPSPVIAGLSPSEGLIGSEVSISGLHFGPTQGSSAVTFNGMPTSVTSWSDTQIVTTVPNAATTGPVIVTVNGSASNNDRIFTVLLVPSISGLSPTYGFIGESVTITGSNFSPTQGTSTMTFNGIPANVTSWSDTQIIATVPAGATTGPVVVTVNGISSNNDKIFTVLIDSDNDGMTDTWETNHGLNPNDPTDATQDPDQDGLTNLREFQLNSNPNNKDSDGDGLPDGWEVSYNLVPTDNGSTDPNNGASGDPDGDGVNNLTEYQYNQNPQEVNLIQIEIDPSTATPVSIGGRRSYEVVVRNARLIPDTVSISVTGIDPSWYSLSDTSLMLLAGEERRVTLNLHLPEDCSIVTSVYDIRVRATPQTGLQVSAGSTLLVYSNPIITDITPGTDETLASNQMAIHWMTDASGTTEVFYRSESETAFTSVTGALGTDHQVTLDGLVWNSSYDWYVRTQTACGVSQSATRSAFISAGIIFENAPYEFFIERDYEQPAYITVRNIDSKPHNLLLQILNPAQDLIAGFRGDGSVDQVISLVAGERKTVEVAFHAQDAKAPQYALQFKIVSDPESSRPVTSYAPVTVHVRQPVFRLQITQVSQDPQTLTATYRITNTGDPVTDLMVTSDDTSRPHIMMQPTINHGELRAGGYVDIVMMSDQELSGQLLLKSALGEASHPVSFGCGTGKSLFQVPVEPQTLCLNIRDTYCQNKPKFRLNFKTPSGLTQDNIARAGFFANFYAKNSNYRLKPYDTYFYLNEKPMMTLLRQVPTGEKGVLFPPDYLNYALNGTAQDTIRVDTRQFNGGHYRVNSDFTIVLETEALKVPVCASTQEEALTLAQPRITPLSCNKDLTLLPVCPTVSSVRTLDPVTGNVKTRFQPGEQIRVEVVLYNPSLVATGTSLIARFDDNVQDAVPPVEVGESVVFTGAGIHKFYIDYTPAQEPASGELWIAVEATDNASCQDRTGYATFVQVINDRDGDGLRDSIDPCPDVVDCDGDGLTDYEEVCYDGDCRAYNPYNPDTNPGGTDTNVQDNDSDNDGYFDQREKQRASNPLDSSSFPAVTISGHVYGDRNRNGQYDAGEGIEGAELVLSPGLTCTQALQNFVVRTAQDGNYQRVNMPECIYEMIASWDSTNDPPYKYRSAMVVINATGISTVQKDIKIEEKITFTVLAAEYSDQGFKNPNPTFDDYKDILQGVEKYYREISGGLLKMSFNFYNVGALQNPESYYVDVIFGRNNWQTFAGDALCAAIAKGYVTSPIRYEVDRPVIVLHPDFSLMAAYYGGVTCKDQQGNDQGANTVLVAEKDINAIAQDFLSKIETNRGLYAGLHPGSLGAWVHEIGHYLGARLGRIEKQKTGNLSRNTTPDLYKYGNIKEWDLMAEGGDNSVIHGNCLAPYGDRPSFPSIFTNNFLGWKKAYSLEQRLKWSPFHPYEISVQSIESTPLGKAFPKIRLSDTDYYYLETRTNDSQLTYWDAALPDEGLIIYKAKEEDKDGNGEINYQQGTQDFRLNIPGYRRCLPDNPVPLRGILKEGESYIDIDNGVRITAINVSKDIQNQKIESTAKLQPLIGKDFLIGLNGLVIELQNIVSVEQTGNTGSLADPHFWGEPDIDLHVYTEDKRHVGTNYITGGYDIDLDNTINIGDQMGGNEWILVPYLSGNAHFVVSSRDIAKVLELNPGIGLTNNGIEQFDIYGVAIDPTQDPIYKSPVATAEIGPGEAIKVLFETLQNPDGTYSISITGTAPFVDAEVPMTNVETDIPQTASGWYGNPVQVSLSATDDTYVALTEYSMGSGATWQPYTVPLLFNTSGVHTLQYRSYDNFDHVEDIKTEMIQLDLTAPGKPLIKDGGIYTSDPSGLSVTWSASDPDSGIFGYQYVVGTAPGLDDVTRGASTFSGLQTLSVSLIDHHTYFICVRAVNLAGLESDQACTDGITFLSPELDPDQDGYTNQAEVTAKSDPFNANSIPGETTLNLHTGFNLVSFPAEILYYENALNLMMAIGGSNVISKVFVFDPVSQTFDERGFNGAGQFYGQNMALPSGQGLVGLIVYAKQDATFTFTSRYCPTWNLKTGTNLVGTSCAASGLSAFQLLRAIGGEAVISSVQRYNQNSGGFETAGYRSGVPVGVDFPIKPGEGYFITMHQAVSNIRTEAMNPPNNQWRECVVDTDCIITGCSGQICASAPVITTCEWREEYACYHDPNITTCKCNQSQCGWAQTPELEVCLLGG